MIRYSEPMLNIIGASRRIDGNGDLTETDRLLELIRRKGLRTWELQIAPARMGWPATLPEGFIKGASAPIEAMIAARKRFADGSADVVVISGVDNFRTEMSGKRREREELMQVYGPGETFLSAYTRLTQVFLQRAQISLAQFERCRDALFENYWRTCIPAPSVPRHVGSSH